MVKVWFRPEDGAHARTTRLKYIHKKAIFPCAHRPQLEDDAELARPVAP